MSGPAAPAQATSEPPPAFVGAGIATAPGPAPSRRRLVRVALPAASFVVVLAAWQILSSTGLVNPLFISSPYDIVRTGAEQLRLHTFWQDLAVSGSEFGIGYAIALAIAVPFGLVTGWYRRLSYFFDPWLNAFNSIPRLALLPLIVLWVGLGVSSKVVVVLIGAFFPIAVNTFYGVRTVDRRLLQVATCFHASQPQTFLTVVGPATVPFIFTGARIGVGRATAGVVVGEFYTATEGIAYRMFQAGSQLRTDLVLFYALVIAALSMAMFALAGWLERRVASWRTGATGGGRLR